MKSKRGSDFKVRSTIFKKKPGNQIQNENSQYMAELCCKLRTSFLLHVSMILLSFLIKKFEYIRPLLFDLRKLMNYTNDRAMGKEMTGDINEASIYNLQSLANIQIYLKNLKEISQNLLAKSDKRFSKEDVMNPEYSDEEDANDPYLRDFRKKEDEKKEETPKKPVNDNRRKMKQFLILWFRQIVIYNTYYVLHLSMANHNMTSILDVKPSIVKATSIKYALMSLMNPRLQAYQQVNNFKSMKRILDNIVTYFFQNFLSVDQRYLIAEDLKEISSNQNKIAICSNIRIEDFFDSSEEFKKFYAFMDMPYYISNLQVLDLSMRRHTNKDYSTQTLFRVDQTFKNGIQIFKQHGVHITQLCFDNCENDI